MSIFVNPSQFASHEAWEASVTTMVGEKKGRLNLEYIPLGRAQNVANIMCIDIYIFIYIYMHDIFIHYTLHSLIYCSICL